MAEKKHNGYGDGQHRQPNRGPDGTSDTGERKRIKDPYSRGALNYDEADKFPSRPEIARERARGNK